MSVKSSIVVLSAAVAVASVMSSVREQAASVASVDDSSGGPQIEAAPQLFLMSRMWPELAQAEQSDQARALAEKIQAAAGQSGPQPAAPPAAEPSQPPPPAVVPAPVAEAPAAPAAPSQQAAGQAGAAPKVDESALRYFAAQGDKARLQAEISRLQALYPNWVPPADPLAVPQNGDPQIENLWRLYAESRFAELRKAIADRSAREPGWQPPADLLDRLDLAEARARLVNASDAKQYQTVVDVGSRTPTLLTCRDVDVLWRVAEAFIQTERQQRGQDVYSYVLKNCDNAQERVATVEKAAGLLPYGAMQALLSLERKDAQGQGEFEPLRDQLARRFVAAANSDPKLDIAPDYLDRLERMAEREGKASDMLLLGWYNILRERNEPAETWFRAARAKEDSASASQGLALALIALKKPQEAEEVMFAWRDESADATNTYLAATANVLAMQPPVFLAEDVLARMAGKVVSAKYAPSAQQFGWYSRSLNQFATAARWFETALRWKADDESSAFGLALTRDQLQDKAGLAEIQRLWAGRSERIAQVGRPVRAQAGMAAAPLPGPGGAGLPQDLSQTSAATAYVARQPEREGPLAGEEPLRRASRLPAEQPALRQSAPAASTAAPVTAAKRGQRRPSACQTTLDSAMLAPSGALQRGWCLMDLNRPLEAAEAFEVALRSPERKTREDAAYGQSLAYLRAGLSAKAAVSAAKAPQPRERAGELQVAILADRAVAAFKAGRYRETLVYLDQRASIQQERVDLMVLRGYCYLNLKMYGDASRIFEAAAATGNRDAMRGLADVKEATSPDSRS